MNVDMVALKVACGREVWRKSYANAMRGMVRVHHFSSMASTDVHTSNAEGNAIFTLVCY